LAVFNWENYIFTHLIFEESFVMMDLNRDGRKSQASKGVVMVQWIRHMPLVSLSKTL